jgi:Ca2+-binding EF-hand superfamily protein
MPGSSVYNPDSTTSNYLSRGFFVAKAVDLNTKLYNKLKELIRSDPTLIERMPIHELLEMMSASFLVSSACGASILSTMTRKIIKESTHKLQHAFTPIGRTPTGNVGLQTLEQYRGMNPQQIVRAIVASSWTAPIIDQETLTNDIIRMFNIGNQPQLGPANQYGSNPVYINHYGLLVKEVYTVNQRVGESGIIFDIGLEETRPTEGETIQDGTYLNEGILEALQVVITTHDENTEVITAEVSRYIDFDGTITLEEFLKFITNPTKGESSLEQRLPERLIPHYQSLISTLDRKSVV